MSSDESQNAAPSERRDAVREKAQQVKARQSRARLIRRTSLVAVALAFVAVIAVVVTWTVSSSASKPTMSPASGVDGGFVVTDVTGAGVADDSSAGGLVEGEASTTPETEPTPTSTPTDAPAVDIRVYVDYLSTGSREFQLANMKQLSQWIDDGAATLTYYPVAMLTAKSNGTKYSLRAAGAAACVAQHSPDYFFAFNDALLRQQPEVDSDGLSDDELATLAQATGLDGGKVVRACIEDQSYASWAKAATEQALKELPGTDGVALTGTPMVLVNGTQYVGKLDDPKEFAQFVLTIASDAYYKATPTPTPTPTAP
ncbi:MULTISPECIES: thioredoxin domain-containing protein [Microbacterium]|uniref:DsbA family protein n=1 Tax=Microbacterium TaxID=33882 RepID=UPI00285DCD5C|nr:thioredoxin domain-containing protein [Microbacterium trichothecenolyticum]MDR7186940.1 protein-disulfide isomerase [Microbacterium trichothecenolyticum]